MKKIKVAYLFNTDDGLTGYGGFKKADELDEFVESKSHSFESIASLKGINFIDFEINESIDKDNLQYACFGRVMDKFLDEGVELYGKDWYRHWSFVENNNKYEIFE